MVVLGGGGTVSFPFPGSVRGYLLQSYPSDATTWTAEAITTVDATGNDRLTVQAYAICGNP
jgi:hypothetical protein